MAEDHFVAYHNAEKRGPYDVDAGTFITNKPYRSDTLLKKRVWVFEGSGKPRHYRLVSSGIIAEYTKTKQGNKIKFEVDKNNAKIDVTDRPWFKELLRQQQSFRNGFNRVSDLKLVQLLESEWNGTIAKTKKGTSSKEATNAEMGVRALIPEKYLPEALASLSESIQAAHKMAPGKWGVRLNKHSIMLKVGFPEVLQVGDGWVHWLVSNNLVPAKLRQDSRFEFSIAPYKNAPACDSCDAELINFEDFRVLMPAHKAAIAIAARSPLSVSTSSNHSTELVDFIAKFTGVTLSQPTYIDTSEGPFLYLDEQEFIEGSMTRISVNRFERDRAARDKCIKHNGADCKACGVSFGDRYGPTVKGFIHVHHLRPLSDFRKQRAVDPVQDLVPVCPNCHSVIHSRKPPLTIEEVRSLIRTHQKL